MAGLVGRRFNLIPDPVIVDMSNACCFGGWGERDNGVSLFLTFVHALAHY